MIVLLLALSAPALERITVDYPIDGSIFPPEILAPTFLWHDDASTADRWLVEIALAERTVRLDLPGPPPPDGPLDPLAMSDTNAPYEPTPYQASAHSWKPEPSLWQEIRRQTERPIRITFSGFRTDDPTHVLSRGDVGLRTSRDPVGAPIFYRDVPLSPPPGKEGLIKPLPDGALPIIAWRLRDLSLPESRVVLTSMPTCANCHSFSTGGKEIALDIDGPTGDKGAYAIAPIAPEIVIEKPQVMTWNSFPDKPPGHRTLGFLSRIRPDGRFVVSTVNEQIYVVNFPDFRFGQVFYPTRGILAWYSRETQEIHALPGADDPAYVHCDPVWTPDGKTIVFARASARDAYPPGRPLATYAGDPNETPIQYDLYRMPFADGRGGTPEPVRGASANGRSNTFPKISPDGRWIVFTQCKNGQLMRPDGRLWIVPFAGGEAREMRCNTRLMNSWHSFSPNGRWLVFSSKANTPYTQMFLTHLDENGNDSPPILIENSTAANRAVNIPEFVDTPYDNFVSIRVPAVEHYRHFNAATKLVLAGQLEPAVEEYRRAIEEERDDSRIHANLSKTLLRLGRTDEALEHTREALRVNPANVEMQTNAGLLLTERGDFEEALMHLNAALAIYPRSPAAWHNLGTLHLRAGRPAAAAEAYAEAIRLFPTYADAYAGRGMALAQTGDAAGARAALDRAIELDPRSPAPWYFRARLERDAGDLTRARADALEARRLAPPALLPEVDQLLQQIDAHVP
jgi:tetratricopeptide (TPR) repeat protein